MPAIAVPFKVPVFGAAGPAGRITLQYRNAFTIVDPAGSASVIVPSTDVAHPYAGCDIVALKCLAVRLRERNLRP